MTLTRRQFTSRAAAVAGLAVGGPLSPAFAARNDQMNILCWEGYNSYEVLGPFRSANAGATVRAESGTSFDFRLGVMVETPRAALRAAEIAPYCAFLSFGTNDLTQMTYGLSRDDAGRFMSTYVNQGVFPEDPFHILDVEGVGELLQLGAERGRAAEPRITLSICGEHGGNPESIAFCRQAGFDYVSCSPFRVPIARLAAAQATIKYSNVEEGVTA